MRRLKLLALATLLGLSQGALGQIYGGGGSGITFPQTVAGTTTSGGIPYLSSTTQLSSSGLLGAGQVVLGGGVGATPSTDINFTYSATLVNSGPGIKVGTTGTSAGLTLGYWGTTGFGSIWANNLTPDATNFALATALNTTYINSKTTLYIAIGGVAKAFIDSTAGQGLIITSPNPNILFQSTSSVTSPSANQLVYGGTTIAAGAAVSRAEINKQVTAIADNVATDLVTITIPNSAQSAGGKFIVKCSAGAGGAIGANEFTAANEYDFVVTRTTGVNAVATLSTAFLTTITASVAGGATPTLAGSISAISGAVGATNTFTFKATVHAITGSSTNHTCFVFGTLLNDNTSGVTIL